MHDIANVFINMVVFEKLQVSSGPVRHRGAHFLSLTLGFNYYLLIHDKMIVAPMILCVLNNVLFSSGKVNVNLNVSFLVFLSSWL